MRNFGNMHMNPGHYGALYMMNPGHYGNIESAAKGVGATGLGVLGALVGAVAASALFPRSKDAALYGAAALGLGTFVVFAPKKDDVV